MTITVGGDTDVPVLASGHQRSYRPRHSTTTTPHRVELGTKFRTDVNGFITGLRFYKSQREHRNAHRESLDRHRHAARRPLTFSGESASGWQQVDASRAPFAITANTTYVVSYHSPTGHYAGPTGSSRPASTTRRSTRFATESTGRTASTGTDVRRVPRPIPSTQSNYWVDVVFATSDGSRHDAAAGQLASLRRSGATGIAGRPQRSPPTSTKAWILQRSRHRPSSSVMQRTHSSQATVSYSAGTRTATLQPAHALAFSSTYTATVRGGSAGVKDVAGNPLASDFTWSFTTSAPPPPPPNEGPGGPSSSSRRAGIRSRDTTAKSCGTKG